MHPHDVVYYAVLRSCLLVAAVCVALVHLVGCKGVGAVCENSGSTSECGDGLVCTFVRSPATFDPNIEPPPPLSVCLRQCTTSTDCADAEVCRFVYCSDTLNSCQTGPVQDAPNNVCGMGGMGGGGGMGGMGGGTGGTGGAPLKCDSTAIAFIKTIDTSGNLTNNITQDTTNLPTDWDTYSITLDLTDPLLQGQSLQFGFSTLASDFGPAGVFYDNTLGERDGIGGASGSPVVLYQQDFEALDPTSATALEDDGWLYFGNVFQEDGTFKFGFGPFAAPTTSGQISGIPSGEGGPAQGDQQLVVFSNYDCCQPDEGHFNGTDVVDTIVFQERPIPAEFIGQVFRFTFDAKRGNINEGCPIGGTGGIGGIGGGGGGGGGG